MAATSAHIPTVTAVAPLSMPDVELLVKSMYEPGPPKKITEIEATLRVLQRSEHGWEMANALLSSNDDNVRFFGALTFTVKLNADSDKLDEDESEQLLATLINWLVRIVSNSKSALVTKKLCSTLITYFCKPLSSWTKCIQTLICSFCSGISVPEKSLGDYPPTWDLLPLLTDDQLLCVLLLSMDLAEEVKKMNRPVDRKYHDRVASNLQDLELLLHFALAKGQQYQAPQNQSPGLSHQVGEKLCSEALKCFASWVFYAQQELKDSVEDLARLRSILELALSCLQLHVDNAMDLFSDILEEYPKFFEPAHLEVLWSEITSPWGIEILKSFDAETPTFARLVIAFAQVLLNSGRLYKEPEDAQCQQVMGVMHELLKYPGHVGENDEIAPIAVDFWTNWVSTLEDEYFEYEEDKKPPWTETAKSNTLLAISELWNKIRFPPPEITNGWDSEAKKTFKVFRADVRDLIQAAYEQLLDDMLDRFILLTLGALGRGQWLELEAGLFCLNALAEGSELEADERLKSLFNFSLFNQISEGSSIPAATRRTAVDMVGFFTGFFLRNVEFLPPVLTFLFSALAQPSLANSAAKSFASLCSQCRKSLTGELDSFFQMYQQFLQYPTADALTKSKVLEGITSIVEALTSEEQKHNRIQQLLNFVAQDADKSILLAKDGHAAEEGVVSALAALQCLTSMGKALQAPDEAVIDLETEKIPSTYWTEGPGAAIQKQVVTLIEYLTKVYETDSDIIEEACSILRTGYKETIPGPFVLPPKETVDFISRCTLNTPRLPFVLETACIFLTSHKSDKSSAFFEQAQHLLHHVLKLMQQLGHPSVDPDVSVGCIEVVQRIINTNAGILKNESPGVLQSMFNFSVECVKCADVLPKRAASQLWNDIFALSSDTRHPERATAQDIVNHFAPSITLALIFNICGEVDASSLDYITPPLRKMIQSERNSRAYITAALQEQRLFMRITADPSTESLKRTFVEGAIRYESIHQIFASIYIPTNSSV